MIRSLGHKAVLAPRPRKADFLLNRNFGMDYDDSDLDEAQALRLPTLNPVFAQRICRDKALTADWLKVNGFLAPATVRAADREGGGLFSGGAVLKYRRGMQGRGMEFYSSGAELDKRLEQLNDRRRVLQERIYFSRELRSLHIGGNTYWFEKTGGNLFAGGKAVSLGGAPAGLEPTDGRLVEMLGLRFGAIDYLEKDGRFFIVDVNCYPGVSLALQSPRAIKDLKLLLEKALAGAL